MLAALGMSEELDKEGLLRVAAEIEQLAGQEGHVQGGLLGPTNSKVCTIRWLLLECSESFMNACLS